jgi:hypothetical protein
LDLFFGARFVLVNLGITGGSFDHFAIHLHADDEPEELVLILTFRSWLLVRNHDRRVPEISPQTVGIFNGTSSTAPTAGGHDGIVTPEFKICTLGRDGLLGVCEDQINCGGPGDLLNLTLILTAIPLDVEAILYLNLFEVFIAAVLENHGVIVIVFFTVPLALGGLVLGGALAGVLGIDTETLLSG